jgi:hypothetical protein
MKFKEWKNWFKSLHLSRKWFVILIIIRPIIDNFWELKESSALASPLYIVGVATPVFIALSFTSHNFRKQGTSLQDLPFSAFSIILILNCLIYYSTQISVSAMGDFIKYTTPIILYYYSRCFVRNKQDIDGIIFTTLIACIFPFGMLLYESIFNPIAVEYLSSGRGGGSRIRGAYADIMTYAIYIIMFFVIFGYYFLDNIYNAKAKIKVNVFHITLVLVIVLYGLIGIKQVSTWTVALAIFGLLILHNLKNAKGLIFVVMIITVLGGFFAETIYTTQIEPLIGKEIKVVDGETESNQALNGRMSRWEKYFEIWEKMPIYNHFAGITSANFPETEVMIGAGMHSDYVRLLFLTGFIGIALYIVFILLAAQKYTQLKIPEKFLLSSMIASLLLWSVSTIPTLYAPLLYFIFPIFSYSSLNRNNQY